MQKILVVIGARGGSKGVKNKNIKPLLGKPLIAYTIEQAKRWGKAAHIVVSTDSEEIARVAKEAGAEVPFLRPAKFASDEASKGLALHHALVECEKIFKERFDIIIDLDATAPIRKAEDIEACLKMFLSERPTTLFSVVKAHKNPYFNMVEKDSQGRVHVSKKLGKELARRQDAPDVYAMNASIYIYGRDYVLSSPDPSPYSDNTKIYIMDDYAGTDIDREIDFKFIEFLLKEGVVKI